MSSRALACSRSEHRAVRGDAHVPLGLPRALPNQAGRCLKAFDHNNPTIANIRKSDSEVIQLVVEKLKEANWPIGTEVKLKVLFGDDWKPSRVTASPFRVCGRVAARNGNQVTRTTAEAAPSAAERHRDTGSGSPAPSRAAIWRREPKQPDSHAQSAVSLIHGGWNVNAFEQLGASLLTRAGYWVYVNYKVELTKEEKRQINRPSAPRWEIDLVAYKAKANELLALECKSYLDSGGVYEGHFGTSLKGNRHKLFNEPILRQVVFSRLEAQLLESGSILPNPNIQLALLAGNIKASDRPMIEARFKENGWLLFDAKWIRDQLQRLSVRSYEDDVAALVSKLLLRPA